MDYEAAERFKPYLGAREIVRWTGRPQQGLVLRASDTAMIPFSLLWCGFAIFWESAVVLTNAPFFFKLWGIPFVLVGLYMVVGRFFYDAFVRSKTYYALTDQSALILGGFNGRKLTSVDLKALPESHLKIESGGRGTIVFGADTGFASANFGGRYAAASPEFLGIADAAQVYGQIQQKRSAA